MIHASGILRSGIVAASLAVLFGAGTMAADAQEPMTEQCLNPETCPIPYVRLAKQETEPFKFRGHVVDVNFPRYQDYKRAIRRFPDVRSCLTSDEREKPQPDLRQIDWDAIRSIPDIDVCVFRIASSADDLETINTWLRYHEFSVAELARLYGKKCVPKDETDEIYYLSASLSRENFGKIIPRWWIERLLGYEGLRNYSLVIEFSLTFQVVSVRSIGNSIFN